MYYFNVFVYDEGGELIADFHTTKLNRAREYIRQRVSGEYCILKYDSDKVLARRYIVCS